MGFENVGEFKSLFMGSKISTMMSIKLGFPSNFQFNINALEIIRQ
jgi:hypothetical protein